MYVYAGLVCIDLYESNAQYVCTRMHVRTYVGTVVACKEHKICV